MEHSLNIISASLIAFYLRKFIKTYSDSGTFNTICLAVPDINKLSY